MADRAVKSGDDPLDGVVDLNNDDRWAARLEEARARREIALREKAISNSQAKRKPKPWEDDAGDDPDDFVIEPMIEPKPEDDDRVDFADRVDAMRKVISREPTKAETQDVPAETPDQALAPTPPKPDPRPTSKPPSFDEIIPPPAYAPVPKPETGERKEEVGLVASDAPDVSALAARYAASLAPAPVEDMEPEPEVDSTEDPVRVATKPETVVLRHRPRGLALLVLVLALIPFTTLAPPLEKGPPVEAAPNFGSVPALGMTTAMLWRPTETSAREWLPPHLIAPSGPLNVVPAPLISFSRKIEGFTTAPGFGDPDGDLNVAQVTPATRIEKPGALAGPIGVDGPLSLAPQKSSPVPRSRPSSLLQKSNADPNLLNEAPKPGVVPQSREASNAPPAKPVYVAPISPLRVTILVPTRANQTVARGLAADVQRRGHNLADVKNVNLTIGTRNIRYFHASDREEAARLASSYDASLKDFSWFRPRPDKGTVELWLSGKDQGGLRQALEDANSALTELIDLLVIEATNP